LPLFKEFTDNGDGSYTCEYAIDRDGSITVAVVLARRGGLYAEYFNNAFLSGVPILTKVDNSVDFDWLDGMITSEAGDFVSAHLYGKLLAPSSEEFIFTLNGDDGFRLYLNGQLLIDRWDTCCDEMTAKLDLVEGVFYDLVLEYKELDGNASLKLEW
jgi:beta-glucosidase